MRVSYSAREDKAHLALTEYTDADAVRQYIVSDPMVNGILTLVFSKSGRLLGIEVLGALGALPEGFLDDADRT